MEQHKEEKREEVEEMERQAVLRIPDMATVADAERIRKTLAAEKGVISVQVCLIMYLESQNITQRVQERLGTYLE